MLEELINHMLDVALRHQAIKTAKYQSRDLINQQNSNAYMQFIIEDDIYTQFNANSNAFNVTLNIDIIGFVTSDYTALKAQSEAFQVGVEIISYLQDHSEYRNVLSVEDYSFLSLSRFTDDVAAGQRITLELVIATPLNNCSLLDNFTDKAPIEEEESIMLSNGDDCTNERFTTNLKKTITLKR